MNTKSHPKARILTTIDDAVLAQIGGAGFYAQPLAHQHGRYSHRPMVPQHAGTVARGRANAPYPWFKQIMPFIRKLGRGLTG
ncbi:hypothetical protein [Pendulispora albinea]|uniref:Uncharacterized protein n=1 Tax=Pendulispora albinea TaxID=2741071 RepID=A0ABZ2LMS0_9BACT